MKRIPVILPRRNHTKIVENVPPSVENVCKKSLLFTDSFSFQPHLSATSCFSVFFFAFRSGPTEMLGKYLG